MLEQVKKVLKEAPRPSDVTLTYGTAGFRAAANKLSHAMLRCGVVAALRSHSFNGKATGVCITASHNEAADNGVKLVEPDGGMFPSIYESDVTNFINATDQSEENALTALATRMNLGTLLDSHPKKCIVVTAHDTRQTSADFSRLVSSGASALNASVIACGLATTPMLHWTVWWLNHAPPRSSQPAAKRWSPSPYFEHFDEAFDSFLTLTGLRDTAESVDIRLDAAYGVGSLFIHEFRHAFRSLGVNLLLRNMWTDQSTDSELLNKECGADFVQKRRRLPRSIGSAFGDVINSPCFSLDGDADRVVFFLTPENDKDPITLIDGDRIATTIVKALLKLFEEIEATNLSSHEGILNLSVIQTAYANGGSTSYLQSLAASAICNGTVKLTVESTKTGVKNLHHKALAADISVYFEANGHGTLIFNEERVHQWELSQKLSMDKAWLRVRAFMNLFNQTVGDAIVDALAFITALKILRMTIFDCTKMYDELQVVQEEVKMPRSTLNTLISHPEHERWLISPENLQQQIDLAVSKFAHARAFVRASGTSDICRVYVEGPSLEDCHTMAGSLRALLESL